MVALGACSKVSLLELRINLVFMSVGLWERWVDRWVDG